MTVIVAIQARMGSTRLPGKVLRPLHGIPLLDLMLRRVRRCGADVVLVATSDLPIDDPIAELAIRSGIEVVRGSEADVLGRYGTVLDRYRPDHVVRLTADCPLTDPALVDEVVARHMSSGADFTSNTLLRTLPVGLDVEVMTGDTLGVAVAEATRPDEREHVTPFVNRRPERFALVAHLTEPDLGRERWTVDTPEDFAYLEQHVPADRLDAPWTELARILPTRAPTGTHLIVARSARSGWPEVIGDLPDPAPVGDPGRRTWDVIDGGRVLGQCHVAVETGIGHLGIGLLDAADEPRARDALARRLRSDVQVLELV